MVIVCEPGVRGRRRDSAGDIGHVAFVAALNFVVVLACLISTVKMQQGTQLETYEVEYPDAWALLLMLMIRTKRGHAVLIGGYGQTCAKRLILAGGLSPENVASVHNSAVWCRCRSGVEGDDKGIKDSGRVRRFIQKQKMAEKTDGSNYAQPTDDGHGDYGGRFVAETLTHALDDLARLYNEVKDDPASSASYGLSTLRWSTYTTIPC